MKEQKAVLVGGGVADWGKAMAAPDGVARFTYATEGTARLSVEDRDDAYLYVYFTGVDDINDEHIVTSGFGNGTMTDGDGDTINIKVDWYWKDQQDQGRFTLWSGNGKWAGIEGVIDVKLKPALTSSDSRFGAFLEGEGTVRQSG